MPLVTELQRFKWDIKELDFAIHDSVLFGCATGQAPVLPLGTLVEEVPDEPVIRVMGEGRAKTKSQVDLLVATVHTHGSIIVHEYLDQRLSGAAIQSPSEGMLRKIGAFE